MGLESYPGTPQHQALLSAIASYYANDARILAVSLFGSLGRGTWDRYSDLDLDVVICNDVKIEVVAELTKLSESFATIGERAMLIIPDGDDAGDMVLESLMELSIRYHPLHATSPNIVESLQLLTGRIDQDAIKVAGQAYHDTTEAVPIALLNKCLRYAVEVDTALHRQQIWSAVDLMQRMRALVMELYTLTHKGGRPLYVFQAKATAELQRRLGATLPQYDLHSITKSLKQFLDFLENDLDNLTDGKVHLTHAHRTVLKNIQRRQANLNLGRENES